MTDTIWDVEEFKPYHSRFEARLKELNRRAAYYDGSRYDAVLASLAWLRGLLSREIKKLYQPLARAVDIDCGIIPAGWSLPADIDPKFSKAINQIQAWSDWGTRGVLYVHYGAMLGLSGLKVCDVQNEEKIEIEPIDPRTFILIKSRPYAKQADLCIIVEARSDSGGSYEYAEVITPEKIRTYRDGVLYGFDGNAVEYANAQQVVPVVEIKHKETGAPLGECTFSQTIDLLDEVNEHATRLSTVIDRNIAPQWMIFGAEEGDLTRGDDNAWFFPTGSDGKPMVAPIDIRGTLAFIREIAANMKESLPELSFDDLRRQVQIATATIELQLIELVIKVHRCRPNYDAGLVAAYRLAGKAAASMGLKELVVLDDDLLRIDPDRAVLPLDPLTRLAIEQKAFEVNQLKNGGK